MKNPIFRFRIFPILLLCCIIIACNTTDSEQSYPVLTTNISADMASKQATQIRKEVAVSLDERLELNLWASDTLVNDPIAISVDENGQIYYTLATRLEHSEFDIRGHRNWMTASISFQTVEDRRDFLRKTFSETNAEGEKFLKDLNEDGVLDWRDLTVEKEQIWVVSDQDNDGLADRSQLFIQDFHEEMTDCANGIEYADGEVYLSVGPDLWRIKDTDGDGIANEKTSISHGYTIHIAFGAHGMSGVKVGPQGRIWWGTGDIGTNVVDQNGKRWKYPNQGTIVRCDPDGSNFEVFAAGLRNTHEFTFDKYGNLITEDNDGDHQGERERLVYLIDGSDTGWRINWQFGKYTDPKNNSYKVWMDENMHVPPTEGQAAYFLPCIQNYINGPTGFVYNPGTALNEDFKDHFFVAEFRGTPANSPIHAFTLKPKGASFELDTTFEVVKGLLPTGLDFAPDGALYFGDWIDGWGVKNEGRIWKLDVSNKNQALRTAVKNLIASDFSKKTETELSELLGHQDMRVRKKAQFELVKRAEAGSAVFITVITKNENQLARIHSIWGLGQLARTTSPQYAEHLASLLNDQDDEIKVQAAKMLGDVRFTYAGDQLISLLKNPSLRVQLHAIEALGRLKHEAAIQPILDVLLTNNDEDLWLRHAGMIALGRIGKSEPLVTLKDHQSLALRKVAVVALRRMASPDIAEFLTDSDEYIVTEAARGINDDFSIPEALPALANILKTTTFKNEALIRRAINANLRIGESSNFYTLLDYTQQTNAPSAMRAEALAALGTWANPSPLDRVDGRYRGEVTRDETILRKGLSKKILALLQDTEAAVQVEAAKIVANLKYTDTNNLLFQLIKNSPDASVRQEALRTLGTLKADNLTDALELAINDASSDLRSLALSIVPESDISDTDATQLFTKVYKQGTTFEKQSALNALGNMKNSDAALALKLPVQQLINGIAPHDIRLDIMEAALTVGDETLKKQIQDFQNAKDQNDPIAAFKETLVGGNRDKGQHLFYNHEAAQCVRCHAIFEYGGNAGPGLAGLGDRLSKEKILESLIEPSAVLAKGYGVVSLELKNSETVSGIILEEDELVLKIRLGKEDIQEIVKEEIANREDIPSSMPSVKNILSKKEIRDLVAFLGTLKQES